jgi:predicted nucleic acid-binding protein
LEKFILDACSLIAFINAEEGGEKVKKLLEAVENEIYMHMINLGEVYYGFYKVEGRVKAETAIENLMQLPIYFVEDMSLDFVKTAGRYKASYKVSFADAFVLALAEKRQGQIVTTDRTEFEPVARKERIGFFWLR